MALEVNIKKKLAHFTLDVAFSQENEVVALLGASGCGKSMTLKCIAGIEKPDEGRIVLNGRVLFDSKEKINLPPQQRHVGYMFQDYALFPNMTVEENILAGAPKGETVDKYIEKFKLRGLEKIKTTQLSGGQKQRVALARMLAAKPEVILLDEPFSALDSHLKWELEQQMVETLKTENKPSIFVSHNRDEVYRICSKVGCIDEGKMEEVCGVKEFFKNPKTRNAAKLSGCKNISNLIWLEGDMASVSEDGIASVSEKDMANVSEDDMASVSEKRAIARAADWNVNLVIENPRRECTSIGIRAHYLEPIFDKVEDDVNVVWIRDYKVIEDPFEWILLFRNVSEDEINDDNISGAWLQWKCAKAHGESSLRIPKGFRIVQEAMLLLE